MPKPRHRDYRSPTSRTFQRASANLLLVLAVALLLFGLYGGYRAKRFNQRHGTAMAVVTRVDVKPRPRVQYGGRHGNHVVGTDRLVTLFVRYPSDRGMIQARIELGRSDETFTEGQTVPVLYDPWKPRHARLTEYQRIAGAVLTTLALTGLLLVLWQVSLPEG